MIKFYKLSTSHNLKANEDIKSVEGIYLALQNDFEEHFKSIKELQPKSSDFRLKDVPGDPAKNDKNNAFYDKYVSATGKLNAYTRREVAQMINNIGGHFQKKQVRRQTILFWGN
jgi:NAD-dependent DNA ligase